MQGLLVQQRIMNKQEAINRFVETDFNAIPQEWVKALMEQNHEYHALPMWGTMWRVSYNLGEQLWKLSEVKGCEEHNEYEDGCDTCANQTEEMRGERCVADTAMYIYEVGDEYVVGIHGAGWNFYDGVWDVIYDKLGYQWHDED